MRRLVWWVNAMGMTHVAFQMRVWREFAYCARQRPSPRG